MFLAFTCLPGESYHRQLRSLLFTFVTDFKRKLAPLRIDSDNFGLLTASFYDRCVVCPFFSFF